MKLLVLGAGGHGKAVAEAAVLSGEWQPICFVDDRWPQLDEVAGFEVVGDLGCLADVASTVAGGIAAVGNNFLRRNWHERIRAAGIPIASVIHPRAWVSPTAQIGPGSAVMPMVVVGNDACLGQGVIVNAGAIIDHDVCLGDFAHIGVGVSLAGGVQVGEGAWMQAGCSAGYGVKIESYQVLMPGCAMVFKD